MFDVITIGSATRDNFLESDYKIINWPKTPLRKAIILPLGEKLGVRKVFCTIGGNAANAGVTFARQSLKSACMAKVGNDLAGKEIEKQLRQNKVIPIFKKSSYGSTAYSAILLIEGERTILNYHGAANTLEQKDISWDLLKSDWWYLSLAGDSIRIFKPLIKFAKENNIKVAFNPSNYHIKNHRQEILNSLKDLTFLVLNQGEAAELVQVPFYKESEVFKKLDRLMPAIVAVTNGPYGVTVSDGEYIYKAGIFREKKLIDRTGAGDAFGSGFVAGLMGYRVRSSELDVRSKRFQQAKRSNVQHPTFDTESIKYAIRLATANATSVVEHIGATEGILTQKDFRVSRFKDLPIQVKKIV